MDLFDENPFDRAPATLRSQGWFNAQQAEVQLAWKALQPLNLDRDALYNLTFEVSPDRPLYKGEKLSKRESSHQVRPGSSSQPDSAVKHSRVEKKRRGRHQKWHVKSHELVPEFAHLCVPQDPVYRGEDEDAAEDEDDLPVEVDPAKLKGPKAAKRPGKDDSFCATIYSLAVCGITLQSEHEGRKLAEKQAAALAERVALLEQRLSALSFSEDDYPTTHSSRLAYPVRTPVACSRPPLSPSPTPTCSTVSHWGI